MKGMTISVDCSVARSDGHREAGRQWGQAAGLLGVEGAEGPARLQRDHGSPDDQR